MKIGSETKYGSENPKIEGFKIENASMKVKKKKKKKKPQIIGGS